MCIFIFLSATLIYNVTSIYTVLIILGNIILSYESFIFDYLIGHQITLSMH